MRGFKVGVLAVGLLASGCSSSTGSDAASGNKAETPKVVAADQGACDPIDPAACLLPWPNDRFARADSTSATGLRLDLPAAGMPANAEGVKVEPGEWNRNDGFAPVSTLLTVIEDLDVDASGLPPVTDIALSLAPDSPVVLWDVDARQRVPVWAELDANAAPGPDQALMIVPATALAEGHRHVVALRDLVRTDGSPLGAAKAYESQLLDADPQTDALVEGLKAAGLDAADTDIAWSFTVGSADSISGRLRHMWDETKAGPGDGAPPFTVTSSEVSGPARIVEGTFEMPKYLSGDGGPGSVLNNDDDPEGLPTADGTMDADFFCTVPASWEPGQPVPTVIYGHGLLGTRQQTLSLGLVGASAGLAFCGLDYIGMSASDVSTIVDSFADLTEFRSLPDRLQQGHLGFLLLGRLLASDEGFVTDPAFQDSEGGPLLDTSAVSLLGASQGGILGGVASSLTNDWSQVVLAVPGMGYNLLLRRSIDFDEFFPLLEASYPDELDQTLLLDLLEQLWQRGENAGYAQHLTADPYPGVEAKNVLLLEAFGDHQVANVSTEKLARTLGLRRLAPTLADGRSSDVEPFWGIEPLDAVPTNGSALVMWDFGTPAPPTQNVPPREGEDPHGKLSDVPEALALVLSFVTSGQIADVCGGAPC